MDPVEEQTIILRKEAERTATSGETIVVWILALMLVSGIIAFSLFYSAR